MEYIEEKDELLVSKNFIKNKMYYKYYKYFVFIFIDIFSF